MHTQNCFITLTYDDQHLPPGQSIDVRDFQLFMKKLRKKYAPKPIRYYHCGEYGEDQEDIKNKRDPVRLGRPHYHALLFGHSFPDTEICGTDYTGSPLYTSPTLSSIWGKGYVQIGEVNIQTAAYVARYVMKKITADKRDGNKKQFEHYQKPNTLTGELQPVTPEYTTMSRRPGIGFPWWEKYAADIFPDDFAIINGRKFKTPKYYTNLLEKEAPEMFADLKTKRLEFAQMHIEDQTPERLATREFCQQRKIGQLKRQLQ